MSQNQNPMDERRLLLAVALSLLLLTGYRLLFPQAPRPSPPAPRPPAAATTTQAPTPQASPSPVGATTEAVLPREADERERRVEVAGRDMDLAFTNRGARLVSWKLHRFTDARGQSEEMVQVAPEGPRPLDVETGDPELDRRLREGLFVASSEAVRIPDSGEAQLVLRFSDGVVAAEKTLDFPAAGGLIRISVTVRRGPQAVPARLLWGPGIGNPTPAEMEVRGYVPPQVVALVEGRLEHLPPSKLAEPRALHGVTWTGVESQYFAAILIPAGGPGDAQARAVELPARDEGKPQGGPVAALDLGTSGQPALLFVGAKDHRELGRLGHHLEKVVPVGDWIGPLVIALMSLLQWIHGHVGNYGWSIVVLTVLINLAMGPLRHYSIRNGQRMAKLAPEMKVIQDRYKKLPALDPRRQEMQKEIGELYARHGMSMGTQMTVGCLPLLLTMPFLIALYTVLQVSVELRGASFLWIPDLSHKDPLFVMPLLMGASMFVMQRMTPTTMDPAQQRIMMIMPLMFMVMFFAAPAGLNIYWFVSNLCSIVQQGITLRTLAGSEAATQKQRRAR
jgi:YidC/Oxa1 family membrane protein insertase